MKQIIFSLFVIGMIATTTACEKTIEYPDVIINFADSSFKTNVTVNQQQIDSSQNTVRAYADPEISLNGGNTEVRGGDLTNVNNGGSSDVNSNSNITYGTTVTTLKNGVLIRIKDPRALSTNIHSFSKLERVVTMLSDFERRDIRDIERENPGKIIISAGYYDANSSPRTTLSFPAKFTFDDGEFVVDGTFGADDDRQENLSALVWSDNFGKVLSVGNYNRLFLPKESNYIVGFDQFGKSAESKTGRTLVSYTHEGELLILVVTNTTQLEAFKFIQEEGGIQVATLNGGGSVQYVNGNNRTDDDIVHHEKQVPLFLIISY